MTNPNLPRYEVIVKGHDKGSSSSASGTRARLFPGGSGAPLGYVGSWQTGFTRSTTGTSIIDSQSVIPAAVAPTPPISSPRASTPSAPASIPVDDRDVDPITDFPNAAEQRSNEGARHHRSRSPRDRRSRSPPIWVWSSPSPPVTPERTWNPVSRRHWLDDTSEQTMIVIGATKRNE